VVGRSDRPVAQPRSQSQKLGQEVYRFRVSLKHRRDSWRHVEIQAQQTLGHFDFILRDAFEHQPMEHLSSFRLLSPGAQEGPLQETDLGTIDPYAEDGTAARTIADLELELKARMRSIYDTWIEHEIELEAVGPLDPRANYPRVLASSKLHD